MYEKIEKELNEVFDKSKFGVVSNTYDFRSKLDEFLKDSDETYFEFEILTDKGCLFTFKTGKFDKGLVSGLYSKSFHNDGRFLQLYGFMV